MVKGTESATQASCSNNESLASRGPIDVGEAFAHGLAIAALDRQGNCSGDSSATRSHRQRSDRPQTTLLCTRPVPPQHPSPRTINNIRGCLRVGWRIWVNRAS